MLQFKMFVSFVKDVSLDFDTSEIKSGILSCLECSVNFDLN